jgi:UDPglucose--hexose-1-phosphate uridylyltransferase
MSQLQVLVLGAELHEVRFNPLIKQHIIVAAHRAVRPWRPEERQAAFTCPFCPGAPELRHLESWDVVVLPNKYPSLTPDAPEPLEEGFREYKKMRALGYSEVVVETPSHEGDLYTLSLDHVVKVVEAYRGEVERLSKTGVVEYVAVFRNKGKEIGVSLTHPHSQIYALPFIPPRILAELEAFRDYHVRTGSCLLCDVVKYELESRRRAVYLNDEFVVLLPFYAMWPYELHVYPLNHVSSLLALSRNQVRHLADALRVVTATYSALLERDAPYIMVFHDHPVRGEYMYHFHVEFYQPYRDKDKLKYAAGIEWGYWVFTYDGIPEERAKQLKEACKRATSTLSDVLGRCVE